jgi:hypothetical protein
MIGNMDVIRGGVVRAHVSEIFHIADEVALGVDNFIDGLLPLLFIIGHAIDDLLGD